jgi:hypothetical protein
MEDDMDPYDPRKPNTMPEAHHDARDDKVVVSGSTSMILGSLAVLAFIFGLAFFFNSDRGTTTASNTQRNAPASTTGSGAVR